jgi:hypothetical protein
MFLYTYIRTTTGWNVLPSARTCISLHFIDLHFDTLEPRSPKMLDVWLLAPPKHGDEHTGREHTCSYTHILEQQVVGMF